MLGAVAPSTTRARPSMLRPSQMSSMLESILATCRVDLDQAIPVTDCPVQLQEQHRPKSHPAEHLHDLWWHQLGSFGRSGRLYQLRL